MACELQGRCGKLGRVQRPPAPAEFLVIDVVARDDVEADEELAGQGHLRLRPSPPVQDGEVAAPEDIVGPGGERSGLAQCPAWSFCPGGVCRPRRRGNRRIHAESAGNYPRISSSP